MARLSRDFLGWMSRCLIVFSFLGIPPALFAQQIPRQELSFEWQPFVLLPTLRRHSNLVQVDVVVRDSKGRAVGGLTERDFKVYDKGKEQTITEFTTRHARPTVVAGKIASPRYMSSSRPTLPLIRSRSIALFFDERNDSFSDFVRSKQAAERFVRKDLGSGDVVGVFTASGSKRHEFTDNAQKLLRAINAVRFQPLGAPDYPHPCTQYALGPYAAYLILDESDTETRKLYLCGDESPSAQSVLDVHARAILSSSEVVSKLSLTNLDSAIAELARRAGTRILVLASSGIFTKTLPSEVDRLTRDALDAGVVVNSLDARGLWALAPGGDAKDSPMYSRGVALNPDSKPLILGARGATSNDPSFSKPSGGPASEYERLILKEQRDVMDESMADFARDTGGNYFHNNNDLDLGLREMASVPAVSYRLGFSPARLNPDGEFHDLKVKLTVPGFFEIQARKGYFAPTKETAKAESNAAAFRDEVMKTDEIRALPTEVGERAGRLAAGGTGFQISLGIDPHHLTLRKEHGRHADKVNLIAVLFAEGGKFVTGESGVVTMALSNKSLTALMQRGLNATIVLPASEGNYRLRVVLKDAASGRMFATSRSESIP